MVHGESVEDKDVPLLAVPVAPLVMPADILIDDNNDPEFVPRELSVPTVASEIVPPEVVAEAPNDPTKDTKDAVYVLAEVGIAGPVVETPDITDDSEEPTLVPPVIATEDSDELIEVITEPEFVPLKVFPEETEELAGEKEEV
jgi:hypothetical protein